MRQGRAPPFWLGLAVKTRGMAAGYRTWESTPPAQHEDKCEAQSGRLLERAAGIRGVGPRGRRQAGKRRRVMYGSDVSVGR